MADIYLVKGLNNTLTPYNESDSETLRKFAHNSIIKAVIKKPRNFNFHKKYFALLNIAYQNLPEHLTSYYPSFEVFRSIIQMKAGYYTPVLTDKGGEIFLPKSISFSTIDNIEFEKIYNSVYDVIINNILVGVSSSELNEIIENF